MQHPQPWKRTRPTVRDASGGAEQPASRISEPASSAAQPASASSTPSQLKIVSIRDVQLWLSIAKCSSADVQRIREAAAVLSRPKPRQEDVRPLQKKWQVPQTIGSKWRPLGDVVEEFRDKVINAAKKLQQELSDSAEQPALLSDSTEWPTAVGSSTDRAGVQTDPTADEDPLLTDLKERQRKRAIEREGEREAEEQRPFAKPKATKRQNKRTAGTASGSVEQPPLKRKDQRLTAELFATCARDPSEPGAASSSSAVQPARVQQQSRTMHRLLHELTKLAGHRVLHNMQDASVVADAKLDLYAIISQARDLQSIPLTQKVLRKPAIKDLYTSVCGALHPCLLYTSPSPRDRG